MNIAQNLELSCRLFPDKPALIFEGRSFSYREVDAMSSRLANRLGALGIAQGDRVALLLPNCPCTIPMIPCNFQLRFRLERRLLL